MKYLINITACVIMVSLAFYFGLNDKYVAMGLIIVASSISIAFINIDRIQEIKGAGFYAKMNAVVKEANASLAELRKVSTVTIESILTSMMAQNFMDGITLASRVDQHEKLIATLKEIGATKIDIQQAELMWNKGIAIIYHRALRSQFIKDAAAKNPNETTDHNKIWNDFQNLLNFEKWESPTPIEIKRFVKENDLASDEVNEILIDYEYFIKNNQLRRKDFFVKF